MFNAFFQVTTQCMLQCRYCFYRTSALSHNINSKCVNWDRITVDLINYGLKQVILTGGDPLHPCVFQETLTLMKFIKRHGIQVNIDTALVLKTDADIMLVADAQPDMIFVSCDSHNAKIHDMQRGQGTTTYSALCKLIDAGLNIHVNCTVTSLNFHQLRDIWSHFMDIGVKAVEFHIAYIPPNNKQYQELSCECLGTIDKMKLIDDLVWCGMQKSGDETGVWYNLLQIKLFFDYQVDIPAQATCKMGNEFIVIDQGGNIMPCFHRHDDWGYVDDLSILNQRREYVHCNPFQCLGKQCVSLFAIDAFWKASSEVISCKD